MGKNPLFSTYRQGENRVTSSMLAVFERIDLSLLETILAAAAGESSLQMVTFTNQPPGRGARSLTRASRPGSLTGSRSRPPSTPSRPNSSPSTSPTSARRPAQNGCSSSPPDAEQPDAIAAVNDPRVVWFNFRSLHDAIDAAVSDPTGIVAEQGRFLLRELQALLVEDGLVDSDDVVVVAARFAYPEYLRRGAYVCKPERAFRSALTHLGFYANSTIQPHVPRIRYREDLVAFTDEEAAARRGGSDNDRLVGEVIVALLDDGTREEGKQYQVFLLSGPEGPDTVRLAQPIANDTVTESGRPWAWTMHQRYASLANLTRPGVAVTSDLGPRGPRP
jgi:hypothetical protein